MSIQDTISELEVKWLPRLVRPEPIRLVGAAGQPAFENSWANLGGTSQVAGFYKHHGRVYLQGVVTGGVLGNRTFLLPPGYRPTKLSRFATLGENAVGGVRIFIDGTVEPSVVSGGTYIAFDGISFVAEVIR